MKKNESRKKCIMLVDRIETILREGLYISPDVMHYIDSTFSSPSIRELEEIIHDESNCEKDSLLELIFFPGEEFQLLVEDLLQQLELQKEDEAAVKEYLAFRQPEAFIHFPGDRGTFKLAMPRSVADQFVSRIKISKKPDKRLVESINRFVSEEFKKRCKVKLRNSRLKLSGNNIFFLCRFFKEMKADSGDFFEHLEFVLYALDEIPEEKNIYHALMDKKRSYFKMLRRAEKFDEQLKKSNIETMIQQGIRAPYINKADVRKKSVLSITSALLFLEKQILTLFLNKRLLFFAWVCGD